MRLCVPLFLCMHTPHWTHSKLNTLHTEDKFVCVWLPELYPSPHRASCLCIMTVTVRSTCLPSEEWESTPCQWTMWYYTALLARPHTHSWTSPTTGRTKSPSRYNHHANNCHTHCYVPTWCTLQFCTTHLKRKALLNQLNELDFRVYCHATGSVMLCLGCCTQQQC